MLNRFLVAFLLMAMALGGCIVDVEDPDQKEVSPPPPSSAYYWNFTIENEAIIAKITTTGGDVDLTVDEDWWFGEDHVLGISVFDHSFWMRTSYNAEVGVGVNDHFVGAGQHGWQGSAQRLFQFDEPGEYWIVVFAEGSPRQVNISVENSTIEVMENKTTIVNYYDDKHEDWDKTYITSPAGTIMDGTLRLSPLSEVMQIHSLTAYHYGSTKLELSGDLCEGMGTLSATTNEEAFLGIEGIRTGPNPLLARTVAVHWPFEVDGRGCWSQSSSD